MTVSIHQPEHLPWTGLLHKIAHSDIHVVLDNVQFEKNNFQNRNRVYTSQGCHWLTVPIQTRGLFDKHITDMVLMENWKKKYLPTLIMTYARSPFAVDIEPILMYLKTTSTANLAVLNIDLMNLFFNLLDIQTPIVLASILPIHTIGKKNERLVNILSYLNATQYIIGAGGLAYIDYNLFEKHNIQLKVHSFKHPQYTPFNCKSGLTNYPSVLDVIANLGKQKVRQIIYENY